MTEADEVIDRRQKLFMNSQVMQVKEKQREIEAFQRASLNTMKSYSPFLALRVAMTTDQLPEMTKKLGSLIEKYEKRCIELDEGDLYHKRLKHVLERMKLQNLHDNS